MMRHCLVGLVALLTFTGHAAVAADEQIFSGPQVGESIPTLKAKGVFGELADNEFNLIERGDSDPVALIFVHARTRPAFGLTNTVMKWAASRDSLQCGVVFLTDDATATTQWMRKIQSYFSKDVTYAVSLDGSEGPGSFGLNRNVTLTVLVGNQGKVTANFALVQPSMQADAPKIVKAIVDVTGGGKVPTVDELGGRRYAPDAARNMRMRGDDPKLAPLLRAVINKQASAEAVAEAVAAVDKYVAKNEKARNELGQKSSRIVNSDRLSTYGTEAAQRALRGWAKKYGPTGRDEKGTSER